MFLERLQNVLSRPTIALLPLTTSLPALQTSLEPATTSLTEADTPLLTFSTFLVTLTTPLLPAKRYSDRAMNLPVIAFDLQVAYFKLLNSSYLYADSSPP